MTTPPNFDPASFAAAFGASSFPPGFIVREKYTVHVGEEDLGFDDFTPAMIAAESAYRAKGQCALTAEVMTATAEAHLDVVIEKTSFDDGRQGFDARFSHVCKVR